ncbi:MAG: DUF481 domain-containing protein [Bacteroidales bacterium]|nr:DUF481 domain-containing protein [Bacteroidales bacterium]
MKIQRIILIMSTLFIINSLEAQKKWNYEFEIGGSYNSGNVNNTNLKNSGNATRNDSLLTFTANYKLLYSKEDSVETNKGLNGEIKFDFFQYDRFSPFFSTEYITNKYKGYDFKLSSLIGSKMRIYQKKDTSDYSISLALTYDYVNYTTEEDKLKMEYYRLSLRPKIKQKLGNVVTLVHYTFYQPLLKDWNDYIIQSTTKIENKISQKMYLDISFEYEYRSELPNDNYKKKDMTTEISLRIKI